ncbi:nucleotidyl transferase AbiEii/AbiGii toxin family protein [Paraflavitalea speifideaquila]|uniref:nucleotidyl transferase AbiEii/AbiGii toxin family protein n=1 Tax=Paraflavitalea speifideaquila TaxID=3076558 RepID=UPI0028E8ACAC|nr:nucleotidyl transferase AbiEii/AbiGii toxin family protein [Paraflavitalea speifideiaquila]
MTEATFNTFRLVGGTALSLQLGHRKSIDIDLFSDVEYGTLDFDKLDHLLRDLFPYVETTSEGPVALGRSYMVGQSEEKIIKLDLFYADPYMEPAIDTEGIRMASLAEITAMKIDVVDRGGRKKDFWDLHELLDHYTIMQMIDLHKLRYPYSHDKQNILKQFTDFSTADDEFDPICLRGKHWELIKLDIVEAL